VTVFFHNMMHLHANKQNKIFKEEKKGFLFIHWEGEKLTTMECVLWKIKMINFDFMLTLVTFKEVNLKGTVLFM